MSSPSSADVLAELERIIAERKRAGGSDSYTVKLLAGGAEKIGRKLVEESLESLLAALEPGPAGEEHLVREAADVIYHLWVLLAWRDVPLEKVRAELARRFGVSGLAEKASRPPTP